MPGEVSIHARLATSDVGGGNERLHGRVSIHARLATGDRYGRAEAEDDEDALVLAPQGQLGSRLPNATLTDPNPSLIDPKRPYPTPSAARLPRLANETPLQTRDNRLQNAPRVLDGQGDPRGLPPSQIAKIRASGADGVPSEVIEAFIKQNSRAAKAVKAVVDNPSEGAFAQLMANLPGLLPTDPELAAVIADEMAKVYGAASASSRQSLPSRNSLANSTDAQGNKHDDGNGQFTEKGGGDGGDAKDSPTKPTADKAGASGDSGSSGASAEAATAIAVGSINTDPPDEQERQIAKAAVAFESCLKEQKDIPNAFHRSDLGDIDLRWGKVGKHGKGLAHFIERRDSLAKARPGQMDGRAVLSEMPETIIKGKITEVRQSGGHPSITIEHGGFRAIITRDHEGGNHWFLSGYEINDEGRGYRAKK